MRARPTTVADVLDRGLAESPDKPVLIAPDATLTYAELDRAADRAAAALSDTGMAPGDRLAVSLPNDSRIVVLFHAAMRMGLIWVGVNQALTAAEQALVMDDCDAKLAIGVPEVPGRMYFTEPEWAQAVDEVAGERPRIGVDPHAPAALAYTSGTTGRPKGVVHSQHNLLLPGAMLVASRGFDASLVKADCLALTILNLQVLSTLLVPQAGGTAAISDVRRSGEIVGWLREAGATVWNGVPPMLYDLAHDPAIEPTALDGLVEVWSGGDNLSEGIRADFTAKFTPPLCGTYGLTEAPTVVAIEHRAEPHTPRCSGTVLPHLRLTVLDPRDGLGELCLSAAGGSPYTPMLGYWNNPDATAEVLVDGRLRTGDIGTVTEDGRVFVHDRRKLMIVRGGANVYPAEVERTLQAVPGVLAAAVLGVPDDRLGSRVAAVVQTSAPGVPSSEALTEHCRNLLSRYKVPQEWHLTTAPLPRNAMGKIDRTRVAELLA